MKFAVIIPTYNRSWILPRAIRSVLSQSHTDWVLYIVDDASGDDTESVASPYLADPRIRYVKNAVNRGTLHSLNVALDRIEADGADWFTWMDDDDQLAEGCLDAARKEIERWPGYGMFLFSTVDTEGRSLARMEVSGPASYLREKLLRKKVAGETHEFVAVPCLDGMRLTASSTGVRKFWFGELSLRTGAVFCNKISNIKEYPDDGITMTDRNRSWRDNAERKLRLETFLVRHWLSVIRRHPYSLASYRVWIKALARSFGPRVRTSFGSARSERQEVRTLMDRAETQR